MDDDNEHYKERRETDAAIAVLRHDIEVLQSQLREDEKAYEELRQDMVDELARFKQQLSGAKGILLGGAFVLSGFVFLVGDRIKELLIR